MYFRNFPTFKKNNQLKEFLEGARNHNTISEVLLWQNYAGESIRGYMDLIVQTL